MLRLLFELFFTSRQFRASFFWNFAALLAPSSCRISSNSLATTLRFFSSSSSFSSFPSLPYIYMHIFSLSFSLSFIFFLVFSSFMYVFCSFVYVFFSFFFSVFFLFWLTGCFVLSFYFLIFFFFFFGIYFLVFAGLLQTRFRNGSRFSSVRLGWYSLRDASSPLLLLLLPCGSTSWLHDYAFASLGPGIVLLVGRVYQWVSLLVLFHVLPHPASKQTVYWIIFSFDSNVWIFFLSFLLINTRIDEKIDFFW